MSGIIDELSGMTFIYHAAADPNNSADRLPPSNNVITGHFPSFIHILAEFGHFNTFELITDVLAGDNYGYIVTHDYKRCNRNETLLTHFQKYDLIPDKIKTLVREHRCKLIYDVTFEGYAEMRDFDDMYQLANFYEFPRNAVIYATGALGAASINLEYCRQKNLSRPIRIITVLEFVHYSKRRYSALLEPRRYVPLVKKFVCLNNVTRSHRSFAAAYILSNPELCDQFFLSYIDSNFAKNRLSYCEGTISNLADHPGVKLTPDDIRSISSKIPMILDRTFDPSTNGTSEEIRYYYDRSLFNLTTETSFFDSVVYNKSTLFQTEKAYKPVMYGQIPIIMGPPYIIQLMRNLKYDMFDDIVDHSYDQITDSIKRFNAIMAEVERLNNKYSIEDCDNLNVQLRIRFENNLSIFKKVKMSDAEMINNPTLTTYCKL